jgi:hypothetical protein
MKLESPGKAAIGIIPKFRTFGIAPPKAAPDSSVRLRPPVSPVPRSAFRIPRLGSSRPIKANQSQKFFFFESEHSKAVPSTFPIPHSEFRVLSRRSLGEDGSALQRNYQTNPSWRLELTYSHNTLRRKRIKPPPKTNPF